MLDLNGAEALAKLGYSVVFAHDVENIRMLESKSLRDYFAAVALKELMKRSNFEVVHTAEMHAYDAFAIADAMLAEREKSK